MVKIYQVKKIVWLFQVIVSGWGTTREYGEQSQTLQKVEGK